MSEITEQKPPEEPPSTKFTPINKMDPSEETEGNEATDNLGIKAEDGAVNNTNGSNSKRKRKSSLSNMNERGVDGSVEDDENGAGDEGASGPSKEEAGDNTTGLKPRKTRKKAGEGNEKPAATKKPAGAGKKKEKAAASKGKGADRVKSKVKEEENGEKITLGMTTPPPEKGAIKGEEDSAQSEDEKGQAKVQKAKPGSKGGWTQEEDEIILNLYGKEKKPLKEVAEVINQRPGCLRVRDAVACKNRWQSVLKHEIATWTEKELSTLQSCYAAIVKDPYAQLAERMNKEFNEKKFTKGGCEKKMKELLNQSKKQAE